MFKSPGKVGKIGLPQLTDSAEGGGGPTEPTFPDDWQNAQAIVIDDTMSASALTGFALYLNQDVLPDAMITSGGGSASQSDGADIRITTDAAGTTEIPVDIRTYTQDATPANAVVEIFTRVPTVSEGSDTTIYIWWNPSSTASAVAADATYGSQNVWQDYEVVLPLTEAVNNDADGYADRTANAAHGTGTGMAQANRTGPLEQTVSSYSDDGVIAGSIAGWADTEDSYTVQCFAEVDLATRDNRLLSLWDTASVNQSRVALWMDTGDSDGYMFQHRNSAGTSTTSLVSDNGPVTGWRWVGHFNNDATGDTFGMNNTANFDGGNYGPVSDLTDATYQPDSFSVGAFYDGASDCDGGIAEVRIRKSAITREHHYAEYRNMSAPSTYIALVDRLIPDLWASSKALVINDSMSDSALTDFPVLLTGDTLPDAMLTTGTGSQSDGADIRFTTDAAGATEMPFEIVEYTQDATPANATAQIWVKVPSIAEGSDTVIYVWWGNSNASAYAVTDTYGRNNVWSDYLVVAHLTEAANTTTDGYTNSVGSGDDGTGTGMAEVNRAGPFPGSASTHSSYDGTADKIVFSFANQTNINNGTMSCWVRSDDLTADQRVMGYYNATSGNAESTVSLWMDTGAGADGYSGQFKDNVGSNKNFLFSYNDATTDWTFVAIKWFEAPSGAAELWENGASKETISGLSDNLCDGTEDPNRFETGAIQGTAGDFNGAIAHAKIRVSSTIADGHMSDDWMEAEYRNQSAPSTYIQVLETPLDLSSCMHWLDVQDAATITGTDPVTAITNKGSAGNYLVANSSNGAAYSATGFNTSYGGLTFDATNSEAYIRGANPTAADDTAVPLRTDGDATFFLVASASSPPTASYVIAEANSSDSDVRGNVFAVDTSTATSLWSRIRDNDNDTLTTNVVANVWDGDPKIIAVRADATVGDYDIYVNSSSVTATDAAYALNGSYLSNRFCIGCFYAIGSPGSYWSGTIAELIAYDRVLSDAEMTAVMNYLSDLYSITLS